MKKSNPITQSAAEYVKLIRADERNVSLGKLWSRIHLVEKRIVEVLKAVNELKAQMPMPARERLDETAASNDAYMKDRAPKRKAVTATAEHIGAALQVLCQTSPRFSALTPKNVAAVWFDGKETDAYRLAGAALKALVADGRATVKRGKYAQVEPKMEVAGDGALDQTA